jgi:ParB/RepB/Spo0J family partition protein
MKIKEFEIGEIKEYENNPRINDEAVEYVANSIKEFGFKVPIIIDKRKIIIAGHTRLRAAEQLGLEKVPCIIASDLTEDQIKAYRLVDNKTSEFSTWDEDKLYIELMELEKVDFNTEQFGFETNIITTTDTIPDTTNKELDIEDYADDEFEHECPKCGFRFDG